MILSSSSSATIKRVVSCFLICQSPPPLTTTTSSYIEQQEESKEHLWHRTNEKLRVTDENRDKIKIAVFHRVSTMPTFPHHWAACSGSIEYDLDATPWDTCCRELMEETNIAELLFPNQRQPQSSIWDMRHDSGLYVDVPYTTNTGMNRIIRVYPFAIQVPFDVINKLELRGTEHDQWKLVSISELEALKPSVPGLALAFHHATCGRYYLTRGDDNGNEEEIKIRDAIEKWSSDRMNGASVMAQNAIRLLLDYNVDNQQALIDPNDLIMLRPSMVAITNAMKLISKYKTKPQDVLDALQVDTQEAAEYAIHKIRALIERHNNSKMMHPENYGNSSPFTIVTFSRSSTLKHILSQLLQHEWNNNNIRIMCSKSSPGDEGLLMAQDLRDASATRSVDDASSNIVANIECYDDDKIIDMIKRKAISNNMNSDEDIRIDLILTGCDCITEKDVVNKVGTKRLLLAAAASEEASGDQTTVKQLRKQHLPVVYCCVDKWKIWDDVFPPPLEDIFECIPRYLYHEILIPPSQEQENQ